MILIRVTIKASFVYYRIFVGYDWNQVEKRALTPPIIPKLTHPGEVTLYSLSKKKIYILCLWSVNKVMIKSVLITWVNYN